MTAAGSTGAGSTGAGSTGPGRAGSGAAAGPDRAPRRLARAPRRLDPASRRAQLVRTAMGLFADHPPELVTPEQVARAAGVSRALFYRYFSGVHELRMAALAVVVDEVIAATTPPEDGPLLDQVRYALAAFLGSAQSYAAAYVALLRTGSVIATDETNELVDGVRAHVVRLVAQRLGLGGEPAPMLELTMRAWFSVVEVASVEWLRGGELGRPGLEDWLVDQLVAMLGTSARHDPATAAALAAAVGE